VIYKDALTPGESGGQIQQMLDAHRTWVFQGQRKVHPRIVTESPVVGKVGCSGDGPPGDSADK